MTLRVRAWLAIALATILSSLTVSAAGAQHSDLNFDVAVRGGQVAIHAHVYDNPAHCGATTILAVHGFTETGATFGPLANAMFADASLGRAVRRVVSIDLPGHGESGFPTGLPSPLRFTDLTIDDNVDVVIQAVDALRTLHTGAQVIMGHSMGGLTVQAAQEKLLTQGSSLARHGVYGAILLAAVPARGTVWTQPPPSNLAPFVVVSDAVLGPYLSLPAVLVSQGSGFRTLAGTVVPNAPTPEQVIALDYNGIEPLTTALQLTASTGLQRPAVRQGAFALRNGTLLSVISFSQDVLTPAVDQDDLYVYLLGRQGYLYRPVVADDAVHSMFVSNPTGLIGALRNSVF